MGTVQQTLDLISVTPEMVLEDLRHEMPFVLMEAKPSGYGNETLTFMGYGSEVVSHVLAWHKGPGAFHLFFYRQPQTDCASFHEAMDAVEFWMERDGLEPKRMGGSHIHLHPNAFFEMCLSDGGKIETQGKVTLRLKEPEVVPTVKKRARRSKSGLTN